MIVSTKDGVRKTNYGVFFLVLSHGHDAMITKMVYKPGDRVCPYTITQMNRVDSFWLGNTE
jgi:hypothetical protein